MLVVFFTSFAFAQQAAPPTVGGTAAGQPATRPAARGPRGPQGPAVISPELAADRHITFRILAPHAQAVRLNAGDIPASARAGQFTKDDNGVWEATIGPVDPGAYRYLFNVDDIPVIDPRNPATSESNNNCWSLLYVPGSDISDTVDVPHGAVASVHYQSSALGRTRRMHVYTPPGYETSEQKFPVFYLLHGAGDCDDSWTSVGRAGFILDNLIAAGKAKPMVVVMPAGHTSAAGFGGGRGAPGAGPRRDEFTEDFTKDIKPFIEKNYRVLTGPANTAIAGLSMGGAQTLNIGFSQLDQFGYIGVFSSGILGGGTSSWEEQHAQMLDDPSLKAGLKLLWLSTGSDDSLLKNTHATVDLLKKHGFNPVFIESTGGHTWINWRNYLKEFAPQLFTAS